MRVLFRSIPVIRGVRGFLCALCVLCAKYFLPGRPKTVSRKERKERKENLYASLTAAARPMPQDVGAPSGKLSFSLLPLRPLREIFPPGPPKNCVAQRTQREPLSFADSRGPANAPGRRRPFRKAKFFVAPFAFFARNISSRPAQKLYRAKNAKSAKRTSTLR